MKLNANQIIAKTKQIRIDTIKMVFSAEASHVGSALSCVDILASLYFGILNINPRRPRSKDRDKLILAKMGQS